MWLVMEWLFFGILRLLNNFDVDAVLALVAIARVCEVDWSALCDQSLFSYESCDGLFVVIKTGAP